MNLVDCSAAFRFDLHIRVRASEHHTERKKNASSSKFGLSFLTLVILVQFASIELLSGTPFG